MENYTKLSTIGQGTFGAVYLVRNNENKKLYALKQVLLDERSKQRSKEAVLGEATILSQLKHPNIVAYHDSFLDDKQEYLFIVQDYCDGGTLEDKIHSASETKQFFEEKQIMQWFIQIVMAIQYMHSQKILHRDIKSQNVFMKKRGNMCKLGDFGISKRMSATMERASTFVGTPYYLAPEMCQDIPYSSKADIWASGCLLYEMCVLKPAFDGSNLISLIFKIVKGTHDPVPSHYSRSLSNLVDQILIKNPDDRPSACQLLKMPYIKSVLNDFLVEYSSVSASNLVDDRQNGSSASHNVSSDSDPLSTTLTHLNITTLSQPPTPMPSGRCLQPLPSGQLMVSGASNHRLNSTFVKSPNHLQVLPPGLQDDVGSETVCQFCGQKFKSKSLMQKHVNMKHPVEDVKLETSENDVVEYEDDFEDADQGSADEAKDEEIAGSSDDGEGSQDLDSSFSNEYCDDFEEYSPEQEMEDVLSCAKEMQQQSWSSFDDVTIVDEGPVDIRQLLKPHCEAVVGKQRFDAIVTKSDSSRYRTDTVLRSSVTNQMCYFIEELYNANEDSEAV